MEVVSRMPQCAQNNGQEFHLRKENIKREVETAPGWNEDLFT